MKTWKIVSGIICCVMTLIVLFQSCAAGVASSLENAQNADAGAGMIVAVLMLAGGIVSIVTRANTSKGGNIALIIIFGIAAALGISNSSYYKDLVVWGGWCAICAVMAVVALLKVPKE